MPARPFRGREMGVESGGMRQWLLLITMLWWCVPAADAAKWRVVENCKLIESESNDGDSFHVRYNKRHYIFRLYFVDAPETDTGIPERVTEQAQYWGVDEKTAVRLGHKAAEFSRDFLKDGFTVMTKFDDARGRSDRGREYAIIKVGDKYLAEELVRNGLARIFGVNVDIPDGPSEQNFIWRLKSAEREAKKEQVGGWARELSPMQRFVQANSPALPPASIPGPAASSASPVAAPAAAAVEDIEERDLVLDRTIAMYSLRAPYSAVGYLQSGATLRLLKLESPTMVRVRFTTPAGQVYEAQARRADLGL